MQTLFSKKITIAEALGSNLLLLLALYIAWEVYWLSQVGLVAIKWHTHLVFAFLIGSLLWLPFFLFYRQYKTRLSENILLAITVLAVLLFLLEMAFCVTGSKKNYSESRGVSYNSPFYPGNNTFHTWGNYGGKHQLKTPEYSYSRTDNTFGFADKEWQVKKPDNKIRIFALGDSFTEGDGAPQDSAYPILLEKILGDRYETMNAGTCGSDPVFNYYNLEKRLIHYAPDIVLQTISSGDINFDINIRGGFERFVNDKSLKYKEAPKWEWLYAISYVSRLFFDALGMNLESYVSNNNQSENNRVIQDVLSCYEHLAAKNGFEVWIVLLPIKDEIIANKHAIDYTFIREFAAKAKHINVIDLLPCYQKGAESPEQFIKTHFWEKDGHHNSKGYQVMARCIAEELLAE